MFSMGHVYSFSGVIALVCVFLLDQSLGHEVKVSGASSSSYAQIMGSRMGADFEFNCPETIETGNVEALGLRIRTGVSASDLKRLIEEESDRLGDRSATNLCLVAKLDFIKTDGILVKSMTNSHQKLIPNGQNQWTWQVKGRNPGEYLISITLSLCSDKSHSEPLATPIAFNQKIMVVGEPVASSALWTVIFIVGLAIVVGGLVGKSWLLIKRLKNRKEIKILPGRGQKIFVSYSKHDRKRVEPVIAHLKNAGHNVWMDRHALEGAASWREEIVEALTDSKYLLFFASKNSYSSINVGKELSIAADESLIIIPVLLDNCEPSGAGKFVIAGLQRIEAKSFSPIEIARVLSELISKNITNFKKPPERGTRQNQRPVSQP